MNKQKVPKLRFPGFTGEWQEKRLGDVADIIGGGTPDTKKEEYWNGHINWFTPTEIKDKYIYHSLRKISDSGLKNSSAKLLSIGTILFTSRATIGDAGFAMQECCTNQGFQSFVVKDKYNKEFIYYWICNNKNEFISKANGSTFLEISKNQITQIPLPLPTLPEQKRIAEFLSEIDTKIEKLSRKKELTEQYKKGAMQKIFTQKVRFKDDNGKNYPDWEEKRLGDVFDHRSERGDESFELLSVTMNEGVKRRSDIEGKDNSNPDKSNYKIVCKNDIVYNSMRMWQGASGVSPYKGIVSPAYTVLSPRVNADSVFFGYFFKTEPVIQVFQNNSQGLTSDTWNLKYPQLSKIKFKMPCVSEQKKIAEFLTNLDKTIEQIENELAMLKEYKKGLLQGMFV